MHTCNYTIVCSTMIVMLKYDKILVSNIQYLTGDDRGVPWCSLVCLGSPNLELMGPLHPKKVAVGEGGREKKSKASRNMGQGGGAWPSARQRHSCRCAEGQTAKKWSPDRPKRPRKGDSVGLDRTACIGRWSKRDIVKCETPNTGDRGRRGRSTRIYP